MSIKYYLCKIGSFREGGEEEIKKDCLEKKCYQYYQWVHQKGAGKNIKKNDILILVYKNDVIAYGISCGNIGMRTGFNENWQAVQVEEWIKPDTCFPLPYGVWAYGHTLVGNKQSIVKEIDALWANDLITSIIMNNKEKLLPATSAINLHLPSIASFLKNGFLAIPPVQRGKVWNAVRTEILWDSLLRKIPIGSLSIRPIENENERCWHLLDGQQRSTAISLGYAEFNSDSKSILWIDLAMASADKVEQNDGKKKESDRKYFFRVTTEAHPWGYHLSDNETKNEPLNSSERVASINELKTIDLEWKEEKGKRPLPYKLWPIDAKLPIPFTLLRQFCEQYQGNPEETFVNFCEQHNQNWNWFNRFKNDLEKFPKNEWELLCKKVNELNSITIVAQNVKDVTDEDVGLYFKRMNKAGIVPNNEEIQYSLLKAQVPSLKTLDTIAEGRMQPARLANIAMKTYLITKPDKKPEWKNDLNNNDLKEIIQQQSDFEKYINFKFNAYLEKIEKWLLYSKEENQMGLPRYVYSSIARSMHQGLFSLLIYFASNEEYQFDNKECKKNLIALITLLCWFSNKKKINDMIKEGVSIYKDASGNWLQKTKKWLYTSIKKELLMIPPTQEVFERIKKTLELKDWNALQKAWNPLGYKNALNTIWRWDQEESRELLLYACREYLQKEFPNYDPVDAVWCEENRPWDYDHIFPQAWLTNSNKGKYQELVNEFLNSIGNIAPLSFTVNRGKGACPPAEYQGPENNALLLINLEDEVIKNFYQEENSGKLEENEDKAYRFARITAERLGGLYSRWYDDLSIENLLDFSTIEDPRKKVFTEIEIGKNITNCKFYYVVEDEYQKECEKPSDWARRWLSCGICGTILDSDNQPIECMLAITSDGKKVEYGIRRHPNRTEIQGRNEWWFSDGEKSAYNERGINEILKAPEETYKEILSDLQSMKETYSFKVSLPSDAAGEQRD